MGQFSALQLRFDGRLHHLFWSPSVSSVEMSAIVLFSENCVAYPRHDYAITSILLGLFILKMVKRLHLVAADRSAQRQFDPKADKQVQHKFTRPHTSPGVHRQCGFPSPGGTSVVEECTTAEAQC